MLLLKVLIPVINESIQIINEDYTNRRMKQSSIEAHRNILKSDSIQTSYSCLR